MKHLNTLRRLRMVLATLVMTGVCLAFLDFRDWLPPGFKHALTMSQFVPAALTVGVAALVVLIISVLCGRVYCSVVCPLGILQDIIARLANLLRRKKLFLGYRPPANGVRYGILAAVIISVAAGWGGVVLAWLDPYSQFGRIAGSVCRPAVIGVNNLLADWCRHFQLGVIPRVGVPWAGLGVLLPVLAVLTLVVILAAWRGRLYCNTICPVGALLGLASKFSLWRLGIDRERCRKCGDCLRSCKAQCIDLRAGELDFSRCVTCYNCVAVCDELGIRYRFQNPLKQFRVRPRANRPAVSGVNLERRDFLAATVSGARSAPASPTAANSSTP
jgi:polyferredoxin